MRLGRQYPLLLPALAVLALFFVGAVDTGAEAFQNGGEAFATFFGRADYVAALLYTHEVAAITTILTLVLGYPVAGYIARYKGNRNRLLILIILPWLVSVVVRTYGWVVVLGPRGLLNSFLMWAGVIDSPFRLLFNTTGVLIGLVQVFLPFMIISILAVFLQVDRSMEEAGLSLGARPWQNFRRVTLPLTLPGILSGVILVYLMTVGAIVTPMLLGGLREKMLGTQIFAEYFQVFRFPMAAAMALILVASALVVVLPLGWIERRVTARLKGAGTE